MLSTALIGCGAIAHEHMRYLERSPLTRVVAVCDASRAAGRYFQERFGIPSAFTEVSELLRTARPDVVHVLTPPKTHAAIVEAALQAGAHVFCEKPIALTLAELDRIEEVARTTGRRYAESHNYRFNDPIIALDRLVKGGRLGSIRAVDVLLAVPMAPDALGSAAGAVHDYLTHACYLLLEFAGSPAAMQVDGAHWALVDGPASARFNDLAALLSCADVRASLRISGSIRPMAFRVAVKGTSGMAEAELFQPFLREEYLHTEGQFGPLLDLARNGSGQLKSAAVNLKDKVNQHGAYHGLVRLLSGFYEALVAGAEPPVTALQIRRTLTLIEDLVKRVPS